MSTAILLGAFLIQGLQPGPAMLTRNLTLTMSFVWLMVISNVIAVGACFLFIRHLARLTLVRGTLLIPSIILLVCLGTFAEKNELADLITLLVFGALGVAMVHLDWPRSPLVLGLVLGPLARTTCSSPRHATAPTG